MGVCHSAVACSNPDIFGRSWSYFAVLNTGSPGYMLPQSMVQWRGHNYSTYDCAPFYLPIADFLYDVLSHRLSEFYEVVALKISFLEHFLCLL